jgi:hypothetical protein
MGKNIQAKQQNEGIDKRSILAIAEEALMLLAMYDSSIYVYC